jgi:predicted RNA binding protein YcfA (HicA-like mRNA interferase family)
MTRAPRLKGKEVIRALERAGFHVTRTRGSHVFLKHPDGRATTVPTHSSEIIGTGLFHAILLDFAMTLEEFRQFL